MAIRTTERFALAGHHGRQGRQDRQPGRAGPGAGVLLCAASLALGACVTINIYFPAAAAEKAADKIIDEVWQVPGKPGEKRPGEPNNPQTGK